MSEAELQKQIDMLTARIENLVASNDDLKKSDDEFMLHEHTGYDANYINNIILIKQTFAATVYTDASIGREKPVQFEFTATSNFTLANPTNCANGKKIIYKIKQDGTGSRVVTFGSNFRGSTSLALPTLTTTANAVDIIGFVYDATVSKWNCWAVQQGYAS